MAAGLRSVLCADVQADDGNRPTCGRHRPAYEYSDGQRCVDTSAVAYDDKKVGALVKGLVLPPLSEMWVHGRLRELGELHLVRAGGEHDGVIAGRTGFRVGDLAERAARHGGVEHLHVHALQRCTTASFADVTGDEEAISEARVDVRHVGGCQDGVGGVEAGLVVPPLRQVAGPRRRSREHAEVDLYGQPGRNGDAVVAVGVGLGTTHELAALSGSIERVHLEPSDRDLAGRVGDVAAHNHGAVHHGVDPVYIRGADGDLGALLE